MKEKDFWNNKKVFLEKKLQQFLFINVSDVQYFLVNIEYGICGTNIKTNKVIVWLVMA